MTNNLIKYKRIIWALSIAVVILILSNYSALRKLDLIIRAPFEEIEEPVFQDSVIIDDKKNANIIVLVIDDLIATGGTAEAAAKLIEISGGKVAGFIFVINLFDLRGSDNLIKLGYNVENLIDFPGH